MNENYNSIQDSRLIDDIKYAPEKFRMITEVDDLPISIKDLMMLKKYKIEKEYDLGEKIYST